MNNSIRSKQVDADDLRNKEAAIDVDNFQLAELVDVTELNFLLDNFCNSIGIAAAIIDLQGKVLIASRWQRICTDFHRINQVTCARCIESDTELALHLKAGESFTIYNCMNGMADAASPIIIEGRHLANVFVGQFLLAPPDREFFGQQAEKVGFDRQAYFNALDEVPIISEEKLPAILRFLSGFAKLVASMGLQRLRSERMAVELSQQHKMLEHLVDKRTRELCVSNEQLQKEIIEREQAEIIAERERIRLQTILKTAIDGIHIVDYDGVLVEANDVFLNMLCLDHSAIGKLRITDWDVQSSWTDIRARMDEMIARNCKVVFESRFRRNDDVVLDVETNASVIEIEGKGYIYAASRDITERKRAEVELREKEERLSLATINNGVGVWDWNLQTQEMIWDDSMYALYHISLEDFSGTEEAWRAALHPDDLARGDKEVEDAISGKKPFETEFRVLWPNGEIRYIKAVAKVFRDKQGIPLRMLGINMDITEPRLVERSLFESEERFKLFMDTLPAAVFIKNEKGAYIYVNRYVVEHFGERDWIGKSDRDIFPPELAEKIHADDLRVLETGLLVEDEQIPDANGQSRLLEARKFRIPRQEGLLPFIGGITLDFTEQRRNAEQYRSVIQASLDGYWVIDTSGRILEVNDSICRMLGYSRDELLRMNISDIEVDETSEETAAHIREIMEKGHVQFEARHKRKDGTIANIEASILYVATLGERFFVFIRDITERKLAETTEALLRSYEQREIVQTSLDGFFVINAKDARIVEINSAFCSMVGYSQKELLTMRISDLEANESSDETAARMKKIMANGYDRFEARHRHKQGHLVNLEASVSYSKLDGNKFFTFVRDITERKLAEKNLRESENRFRTLFESATDSMHILDMEGRIIDINRTGYERLGYEEQELLGRRIAEFDTPECAASAPKHMAKLLKEGTVLFEAVHVCKDGTAMPVEVNARIIHLDGEQRLLSVVRDITERKRVDQQIRELTAHLLTVREEEKANLAREIHDDLGSTLAALKIEIHMLNNKLALSNSEWLTQYAG
jgi:PAS domain S-box-containing protein